MKILIQTKFLLRPTRHIKMSPGNAAHVGLSQKDDTHARRVNTRQRSLIIEFMLHSSGEFLASNPENSSVEENWSLFKIHLGQGQESLRSSCNKYKLPWINPWIKRQMIMRKKDCLHQNALRTLKPELFN